MPLFDVQNADWGEKRAKEHELKKSYFYPPPLSFSWEKTGELF